MSVSIQPPGAKQKRNPKDIVCLRSCPFLRAARNCFYAVDMHSQDPLQKVYVSKEVGRAHLFLLKCSQNLCCALQK